jgi:outer membrane lipoprotein carrier protein
MDGEKSWDGEGRWELRKGYEGSGQAPFVLAQNAHDKNVLVRCAQRRAASAAPLVISMVEKLKWTCFVGGALIWAWSLFPFPTLAAENEFDESAVKEVREVVKQLQARYEKTKDIQADFAQKTTIEGFERPIASSGKVYIKKPGRLRWNYLDPSIEDIYVNRDDVRVYVPEHKQVLIGKLTQMAASKAPLELLLGAAKLDESFDIEPTPGKGRGVGGVPLLTLLPKSHEGEAGKSLQRIVLEVFPKTYFIRTISLYEVSGNVASFEFSSLQSNIGLGDALFDLKLPADVEVVKAPVFNTPQ